MNRQLIAIIAIGIISIASLFSMAYAVDNNCMIRVTHLLQMPIALGCIEDRLDALENAPAGSGNATVLNDLGDVIITAPADNQFLRHDGFKWINESVAGGMGNATILNDLGDVTIISPSTDQILRYNGSQWVNVNRVGVNIISSSLTLTADHSFILCIASSGDVTITLPATLVGKEYMIKREGDLSVNNCILDIAGSGTFDNGADTITLDTGYSSISVIGIASNSWGVTSTLAECKDLGTGGIDICVATTDAPYVTLRGISSGTGISIASVSNNVQITNTSPDDTTCANVGTGSQVYKDGECNFRSVIGSPDISVTQQTNTVTIDYNGTLPVGDKQVAQVAGEVYSSLVKTNIGSAYADIYITAFDIENMMVIDCANVTYGKVVYIWDYVGTGNQQLRWVDASNNANVFYESPTFTTDRDAIDSGFFVKPAWCTGTVTIEQQGKSTVAGDDPVAKGYKIVIK